MQYNQVQRSLNWTGYIYGGLAHSSHIRYDQQSEAKGEASVRRGLKRIGLEPEDVAGFKVMDVGTGLYSLGFHRLGAIVEHHDISARTVDTLNVYVKDRGYTNLKSIHTNLVSDQLPREDFDLIYLSGVFQHLEKPAQALANLSQSLKVGGHLYIDIYRSGRWRWFVVDVLRKIVDKSLLYHVLSRFTELCALGETRSFHLRQVELLIDDVFVENLHLFHPDDLIADARALGLEMVKPVTSMDLLDLGGRVDHSLFFAHVFNTLIFRRTGRTDTMEEVPRRTMAGRCQMAELEATSDAYKEIVNLTSEFIVSHMAGRFPREQVVSHIGNLYRMAHPCLPGDPYMVLGNKEPAVATSVVGDDRTLAHRHSLWFTFLANTLNMRNPFETVQLESLGYELVRFLPPSH
jgi:2-polyprenyl-3-methyl-5-hydroxy-6-metoxy-1,4-benzoquinol methylase